MKFSVLLVTILATSAITIVDRARLSSKHRVKTIEYRKVNEDQLNRDILAVFKRHRITFFTLKTSEGIVRAAADPQAIWFAPVSGEVDQIVDNREHVHHFHNDDLHVDVSTEQRSPPRKPLNSQSNVHFTQFEEVAPGLKRYWARVVPESSNSVSDVSDHVSRRKYAKQPRTLLS